MAHFSKNVPQPFVKLLNISNFKIPFLHCRTHLSLTMVAWTTFLNADSFADETSNVRSLSIVSVGCTESISEMP